MAYTEILEYHGKKHTVNKILGSGICTTAYQLVSGDVICVTRGDIMKECFLRLQPRNNPNIPEISRVSSNGKEYIYQMPYYDILKGVHAKTCVEKSAEELHTFWRRHWDAYHGIDQVTACHDFVNKVEDATIVDESVVVGLRLMINEANKFIKSGKCKKLRFDMHEGNIAFSKGHKDIILLDPFVAS